MDEKKFAKQLVKGYNLFISDVATLKEKPDESLACILRQALIDALGLTLTAEMWTGKKTHFFYSDNLKHIQYISVETIQLAKSKKREFELKRLEEAKVELAKHQARVLEIENAMQNSDDEENKSLFRDDSFDVTSSSASTSAGSSANAPSSLANKPRKRKTSSDEHITSAAKKSKIDVDYD